MKTNVLRIALLFAFLQAASLAFGKGPKHKPKPPKVPIDGGISALVAAGATLGAAKMLRKKKEA